MTQRTCGDSGGRTKDGALCGSFMNLNEENGLCLFHDPLRRAEAKAMRRHGAKAKAEKMRREKAALPEGLPLSRPPRTLNEAETLASWIAYATLTGEIDARTGEAATKALRQFQLTVEKRTLQDRVRELQRKLKEATG